MTKSQCVSIRGPPQAASMPKKKPAPPRPPPPKASAQLKAIQNVIVFTGALQQPQQQPNPISQQLLTPSATAPDLLINWDSPPNSPTQGRWSSDALSLRSFGSDSSSGTTATGTFSTMTRSESGFESEPDLWSEAGSTGANSATKIGNGTNAFLKNLIYLMRSADCGRCLRKIRYAPYRLTPHVSGHFHAL